MSTTHAEHYQTTSNQNVALQRLAAGREELILLSHLLQAAMVVERRNPVRQAITAHWQFVRAGIVVAILLASLAAGLIVPHLF